jgi:hypothetical protein
LNPELDRTRLIPLDWAARRELPGELMARLRRAGEAVERLRARLFALGPEERTRARELPEDLLFDNLSRRADEEPFFPLLSAIRDRALLPREREVGDLDPPVRVTRLAREEAADADALLPPLFGEIRLPPLSRWLAGRNLDPWAWPEVLEREVRAGADARFVLRECALFFPRRLARPGRPPCIFPSLGFQASPWSEGCRPRRFLWTWPYSWTVMWWWA